MFIVNTMYGKRIFLSLREIWDCVASMQAFAWKELDIMEVSEKNRYKVLEVLESWRYARELADFAVKEQTK